MTSMHVISRQRLQVFWTEYPRAQAPLSTWYNLVVSANWSGPADVKAMFGTNVDFLEDNRAIFDIGGNKYRVVTHIAYSFGRVLIKFVGTHAEYDGIDAATVGKPKKAKTK